ncbi:hypothetical protein ACFQDD_02025 [Halorubrum pallidum]|uniref:Uncharacterized protein n=1 Tax=Halorubrum pallidum TaxID=1526114 RepID=A0ABD5T475_9EURY
MASTQSEHTLPLEEKNIELRCGWCDLPRVDCSCDSPEYAEYARCGDCGIWKPLRELEVRNKPRTVLYRGCKGGCAA